MTDDQKIFSGRAWVFGDGINTDVLAPGRYMAAPIKELAGHCLEALDPTFAANVQPGDLVIAGEDFGVGSSREQAAEVLKLLGIGAVIAKSFGGIFFRNAFNLGLLAIVCEQSATIEAGSKVHVDPAAGQICIPDKNIILTSEPVPDFLLEMANRGGLVAQLETRLLGKAGKNDQ
ncbi:MAG: 3-isopropylmalate dehydratase small subunit [Rhizobiales bacterium]|nr:3-isopropylmalate dehydratase small subunit [Hyphomicrobiales bacterium]